MRSLESIAATATLSAQGAPHPSVRLVSLDVFRGFIIAAMIVVNTPGNPDFVYPPLSHAPWHGWTLADLIFPSFLWIVGIAVPLALAKRKRQGLTHYTVLQSALRRSLILFAFGLLLSNVPFPGDGSVRIPGVLQRIAVCYFGAVVLFLFTTVWQQLALAAGILVLYWFLMLHVAMPGFGAGVLQPEQNVAAYWDRVLLHGHLAHGNWDPEGPLSTFSALATTLGGVVTGQWLQTSRSRREKTLGLLVSGGAAVALGCVLNRWFPINKNLWTSSYVVFSGGIALFAFAICYWLVEEKGYRRPFLPFLIFGVNPITVYVCASLLSHLLDLWMVAQAGGTALSLKEVLYERSFASWAGPSTGSLLFAMGYTGFWLLPMAWLYRRNILIKI